MTTNSALAVAYGLVSCVSIQDRRKCVHVRGYCDHCAASHFHLGLGRASGSRGHLSDGQQNGAFLLNSCEDLLT